MARAGPEGLSAKPPPGRKRRLNDAQLQQLETLLLQGAQEHGWPNNLWTARRVTEVIRRHFGIKLHPEHVRNILKRRLGWTSQKPERRARERDEKEIAQWRQEEFPRIKKTPLAEGHTWFFRMNQVSCSLRLFAEPWPLVVKHPFTIAGIDEIASRPSVPSPLVPFANVGDCTSPCWWTMKMFMLRMWWAFCVSLSVIFLAQSRLSGTAAGCMIAPRWFRRIWPNIRKLLRKNFRLMRRNSTPMNKCGRTSNTLVCPIMPHGILENCVSVLRENSITCGNDLICWVPLYNTPKSLSGFDICPFIYTGVNNNRARLPADCQRWGIRRMHLLIPTFESIQMTQSFLTPSIDNHFNITITLLALPVLPLTKNLFHYPSDVMCRLRQKRPAFSRETL